jgi:hypothetical protein
MKHLLSISILFLCVISLTTSSFSKSLFKKKNIMKHLRTLKKIRHLQDSTADITDFPESNSTYTPSSSSSGLSTGGIIGIAIPCIAALVGVGAAAAILGGSAPAAPVLANPATTIPPANYVDTTAANLVVPQEIPVQPQVIQPQVEIPPPQPVQQVVPIQKVEPPVIQKIVPQPVQPQMVPVQQMQLVPVQQVEMVPVQHVEMVPVQEVIPTYQAAAQVVPQVTQVSQVAPQITQVSGIQQGIQGGEFISAPEGYGTSVIQSSTNPLNNVGEFSTNNLM